MCLFGQFECIRAERASCCLLKSLNLNHRQIQHGGWSCRVPVSEVNFVPLLWGAPTFEIPFHVLLCHRLGILNANDIPWQSNARLDSCIVYRFWGTLCVVGILPSVFFYPLMFSRFTSTFLCAYSQDWNKCRSKFLEALGKRLQHGPRDTPPNVQTAESNEASSQEPPNGFVLMEHWWLLML